MGAGDEPVIVIGAGGHARPVVEALLLLGHRIAGVVDDATDRPPVLGQALIGGLDQLARLRREGVTGAVIAIGDNAARLRLGDQALALGFALPTLVHPAALVSTHATLAEGTQIFARAVVGPEARIGRLCLINTGAIVEHECTVLDGTHIAPGAILCGLVTVGERCLVGAGSVVTPGRRIGTGALVAAGATVRADVAEGARVPGR